MKQKNVQITISGMPGSGKSTIAEHLAAGFRLKHYSVGDFMRQLAKKHKVSLLQLSKEAEKGPKIDKQLDSMTKGLRKKRTFVLDSRLGWYFLPKSIKIFVKVDVKDAARRIFNQKRGIEKENLTYRKTLENIRRRIKSERMRYKRYYGIDIERLSNYDIIIDTSGLRIKQMCFAVEKAVKRLLM